MSEIEAVDVAGSQWTELLEAIGGPLYLHPGKLQHEYAEPVVWCSLSPEAAAQRIDNADSTTDQRCVFCVKWARERGFGKLYSTGDHPYACCDPCLTIMHKLPGVNVLFSSGSVEYLTSAQWHTVSE